MHLTKSDFTGSKDCRTKLFYIKNNYPSNTDNEFMENLAENGRVVGKLSQLVYKDGIMSNYDLQKNIEETKLRIESDKSMIVFEPCITTEDKALAKIDILILNGNNIDIIEVKSISLDGEQPEIFNKNGTVKAAYIDYVEDLAFQYHIIKKNYPNKNISAYLMYLDKGKTLKVDDLFSMFDEVNGQIIFNGSELETPLLNMFAKVELTSVVEKLKPSIEEAITKLTDLIEDDKIIKYQEKIGKHCNNCSFKSKGDMNGFKECWKDLYIENNVFDLYSCTVQKIDGEFVVDKMVNEKNISLLDWPIDKVTEGPTSIRQRIQIENTRDNTEFFNNKLGEELSNFKYPLHFMDFETSMPAIPYHIGNVPYDLEAFQFSCHTLYENGTIIHNEWINNNRNWPNVDFAKALRSVIGDEGTVFMWHHHERTVLKTISKQMNAKGIINDELQTWISEITKDENIGRLQDMNRMCKEGYFHPMMKGKTSIKKVLPSIWQNSQYLKDDKNIEIFLGGNIDQTIDLYGSLATDDEKVNVGTDAIMAYEEIMKACIKNDSNSIKKWSDKLLAYCKLDTFAMYIIWTHWINTYKNKSKIEKL